MNGIEIGMDLRTENAYLGEPENISVGEPENISVRTSQLENGSPRTGEHLKLENRRTSPSFPSFPCSPCSPRAPNLLHVLPSGMVGWNDFCTPGPPGNPFSWISFLAGGYMQLGYLAAALSDGRSGHHQFRLLWIHFTAHCSPI